MLGVRCKSKRFDYFIEVFTGVLADANNSIFNSEVKPDVLELGSGKPLNCKVQETER